jgi:tetratricopeptide (TPR) repeat protein
LRASTTVSRRRARGSLAVGVALGAWLALAAPGSHAAAQASVTVRSGEHDGYGRLVFDWPKPVRFDASVDGNQLVIRFDAPLTTDLAAAAIRRLDNYVAHPALSADRRTITFELARPVTLRSFQNERSAVIDLIDQPKTARQAVAQPPAAPPAAPAAPPVAEVPKPESPASAAPAPVAAAAPDATADAKPETKVPAKAEAQPAPNAVALPVRVGQHDDFTRLKFDWPQSVEYRVEAAAGRAKIQFDRLAQIDVAALRDALPRSVAQPELIDNGTGISFAIPRTAQVRHFRSGLAIVLDVMAAPDVAPVASAPAATAPVASAPVSNTPVSNTPVANTPVSNTPGVPLAIAAATASGAAPSASASSAAAAPIATPAPAAAAPAIAIASPALAQAPEVKPPEVKPVAPVQQGPTVAVTYGGGRIHFVWHDAPAAAVFARGGSTYVLFDKPAHFDVAAFGGNPKRPADRMAPPEVLEVTGGSGLRFSVPVHLNPQPLRDKDGWSVLLRNEARRPQSVAAVTVEAATADGPRVAVAMSGVESMLSLTDPERGEPMRVVPVRTAGLGVDSGRQFTQFDILASNQGLVVVPRADGVAVRQAGNNIVVGASRSLLAAPAAATATRIDSGARTALSFARWLGADIDFNETRQSLVRAVSEAEPGQRSAARFELAQFFLARDHAADAAGELNVLASDGARYAADPALKALRGAARVMLQDGAVAKTDLGDPQIVNDPAVLPWRAGAAALRGEWAEADQLFRRAGRLPVNYPPEMRQRLLLLAAEAALNAGDSGRVNDLLDGLVRGNVSARVRAEADYLRARALIASDDRKGALPILQRLASANDQWSRAHGEYLLVDQLLADNAITPAEAIERLDRVRFVWSGDDLEYKLLKRLGELQIEHGDVRSGLTRLREAVTHFPENPDNVAIRARMTDAFADLYDASAERKLPPLTALSLYDDFRDLTPPGARGDTMIQNLADRLVAMDLLDRAGELLDYQIKNRLSGAEKSRVGARLAVVELLDRKPQAAITVLDDTDTPKLVPELTAERRHLKARALSETGDAKGALALLDGDTGRDADLLRAEIEVHSQNWGQAAQVLDRLVGDPGEGVFDAARRRQVLNLAIAYALAGDAEGLRSVRERFGDKMNVGATKDAFGLVTSITEGGAVSDKALSARFAELQEFQQFMAGYREKLKSSALSAIN